jgi:hypothetical protein
MRTRVIVVASADPVETGIVAEWLAEAHEPVTVGALTGAIHQIQSGRADMVVADAQFAFEPSLLAACRRGGVRTPLVAIGDATTAAEAAAERTGAFFVGRPIDRDMLMCSIEMALMECRPVRRSPRKNIARLDSLADGAATALLDVSNEGMRLELRRQERSMLPRMFTVKLPLIGVSVRVRRVWMAPSPAPSRQEHLWCGATLADDNAPRDEQAWRRFVDVLPTLS